jgi:ElaB/YqjD/DUF883 family membrane-anchored ribosome-binding protein
VPEAQSLDLIQDLKNTIESALDTQGTSSSKGLQAVREKLTELMDAMKKGPDDSTLNDRSCFFFEMRDFLERFQKPLTSIN